MLSKLGTKHHESHKVSGDGGGGGGGALILEGIERDQSSPT